MSHLLMYLNLCTVKKKTEEKRVRGEMREKKCKWGEKTNGLGEWEEEKRNWGRKRKKPSRIAVYNVLEYLTYYHHFIFFSEVMLS